MKTNHNDFKVGDRVKVYSLMNPKECLRGEDVIIRISPMSSGSETLLWLERYGAYHPDACEKIMEVNNETKRS